MLRLLGFLFTGCFHKWAEDERFNVYETDNDKRPVGRSSYCHCEKCGAQKVFRMRS